MPSRIRNFLKDNIKLLKVRGSFTQNFAIVFSGSAMTFIFQIILTPIIARIYGPEAYGTFGIFNAIVVNAALFSSLLYEQAFVLPKDNRDFKALLQLATGFSFISCGIILVITSLIGSYLINLFNISVLENWKFLIAPTVLILCLNQITSNWVLREKEFRKSIPINTGVNLGTRVFNIGYGLLTGGVIHGLILGDIIGKFIGFVLRTQLILRKRIWYFLNFQSWDRLKYVFLHYRSFPLYTLPASWLNLFSNQIPIFILAKFFGVEAVGYFALATSLLDMPLRLLGYSLSPVFFQKATEVFKSGDFDKLLKISEAIYNRLLNIGILPIAFLTVFGEILFAGIFGEEWKGAGRYASYMGFFYVFRLISTPLSNIYKIINKERIAFWFSLVSLLTSIVSMSIGILYDSADLAIISFGLGNFVLYLVNSLIILKLLKADYVKFSLYSLLKVASAFMIFFLIKNIFFNHTLFNLG